MYASPAACHHQRTCVAQLNVIFSYLAADNYLSEKTMATQQGMNEIHWEEVVCCFSYSFNELYVP